MIRKNALFCKIIRIKTSSKSLFLSFMQDFTPELEDLDWDGMVILTTVESGQIQEDSHQFLENHKDDYNRIISVNLALNLSSKKSNKNGCADH